jgi:hypothetical protein
VAAVSLPNFFDLCEANRDRLSARAEHALAISTAAARQLLEQMALLIEGRGRISMNRRVGSMERLLRDRVMTNIHAGGSRDSEAYRKRCSLDFAFEDGYRFVFGALHVGGNGVMDYGAYCCVVDPAALDRHGYLKEDSLEYLKAADDGRWEVDLQRLEFDVAPDSHKARLAIVKHKEAANAGPSQDAEELLHGSLRPSGSPDYVEAIMLGPVPLTAIERVRVPNHGVLLERARYVPPDQREALLAVARDVAAFAERACGTELKLEYYEP